jgi:hypothetical protein
MLKDPDSGSTLCVVGECAPEPHVRDVVSSVVSFAYVRRGSAGAARQLFKRHRTSLDARGGAVAELESV